MAKKKSGGAGVAATVAALFTVTFDREKETKNTTRFKEDVEEGRGERGWIEALYLKHPLLEDASRVTATLYEGDDSDVTNVEGDKPTVVFVQEKETKNTYRYAEVLEEGVERGWIGTIYLKKAALENPPKFLKMELEG